LNTRHKLIDENAAPPRAGEDRRSAFRLYDNRHKYLMFVNTCSEKWVVDERAGMELAHIHPQPPALRVFDAGRAMERYSPA